MFDGTTEEEMLKLVKESIKTEVRKNLILVSSDNLSKVLDFGSGSPRISRSLVKKFQLILSRPDDLLSFDYNEIRCCLCNKIVSYPVWYHNIKYAVNHFHYFICWDDKHPNEPSTACYRRS